MTIFRRGIFFALLLLAPPARAARPLNPRYGKKKKAAVSAPQAAPRLLHGGWTADADAAVRRLVELHGSSSTVYDADVPPAAAIAWDGTAFFGDPAEAVFHRLVVNVEFKFSEDFWKEVPIGYGRQKIRAAYEQFITLPKHLWPTQPAYRQFRKYFLASYQDTCAKVGRKECRAYLAKLLIGFNEEQAREYAKLAMAEELKEKPRLEKEGESDVDPDAVLWPRGLIPVPEIAELVRVLRANGVDVWAVAPEPQPVLVESALSGGVDATRVLALKMGTQRGRYDGEIKEPQPIRAGMVDAFVGALGRPPALVVAARAEDFELLSYGSGLRIIIDDAREPGVRHRGQVEHAVLQPPFSVLLTKRP